MLTGSLNLTVNVEAQRAVWFIFPLFPIFIIFFIGSIAETNRPPFDLAEAESELVSGFMTEHAAVIFVFFFLAEYGSIVLICILNTILFLGGYLLDFSFIVAFIDYVIDIIAFLIEAIAISALPRLPEWGSAYSDQSIFNVIDNPLIEGLLSGLAIGFKSCIMVFVFIWVRASFPRIRFDQLMSFCWTVLLPLLFAFIILLPSTLYAFDIFVINITI